MKVFDGKGASYRSDVYSFGVVVWEAFTRKLPWADETSGKGIYVRVACEEKQLEIPSDTPSDIKRVMRAAWAIMPQDRPMFRDIMKWQGWEKDDAVAWVSTSETHRFQISSRPFRMSFVKAREERC